ALFHLPELANAKPEEEGGDGDAQDEPRPVQSTFAAEETPAKPVNHTDHGVEGVEKTPLLRNNTRAESNRRYVEPHLDHEGNDKAEIAILDVERGNPDSDADTCRKGGQRKDRQKHDLPTRRELVPNHQADEDRKANQEIDKGDHYGSDRNNQARKVYFANK